MPSIRDIINVVEAFAPRSLQEEYDNSGIQTAPDVDRACTGVMLSVDVTPEVVDEALASGCNLLLAHHPLLFRGVKSLTGATPVESALIKAVKGDLTIYCCHTSLDNAPAGVSARMASMLGLKDVRTLDEVGPDTGSGAIGMLETPLSPREFVALVKETFGSPVARCSDPVAHGSISRVALCGGSGAFLIPKAVGAGADVFLTSDMKYHDFTDWGGRIFLVDIGHHESENCTKDIFHHIITEKFPNFAVRYSLKDTNPINYL